MEEIPNQTTRKFSDVRKDTPEEIKDNTGKKLIMDGERVDIAGIIDEEITICDYRKYPNKLYEGDYVWIQAIRNGKYIVFPTSSKVLMQQLDANKEEFPFLCAITKRRNGEGLRYYTFE